MRLISLLVLVACASVSCGKKGPPLAPFVRVPAAVGTVTPQRIGDDVYLSFTVPDTNADGQKPAALGSLEIYGVTAARAPETEEQREVATLIATVPVRPILPLLPPLPANASPPPPMPLPPGVDQGSAIALRETLTPETRIEIELPVEGVKKEIEEPVEAEAPFGPLVAPPPSQLPRRHYFVVAVSPRGREGAPSTPVSVPLEAGSSAPGKPEVTHTFSDVTITWTPPPDARTANFIQPPSVKPTAGANATPSNTTPTVPAPMPLLAAKSLGFDTPPTRYHVYDVTPPPPSAEPADTDSITVKLPVLETEWVIKGVPFGIERCYAVRPVDQVFGVPVIGPASPATCVTPQDTFPPAAPKSLAAIAGAGVINLIWDANTEPDLAGYIVLRGEAAGGTLQAITPQPITVTTYRDETVKPGVRYVYAVVAVDTAVPQNASPQSNRAEETARQ
jgi:hypothetical protein